MGEGATPEGYTVCGGIAVNVPDCRQAICRTADMTARARSLLRYERGQGERGLGRGALALLVLKLFSFDQFSERDFWLFGGGW